ncbi:YihY/virulence factor BrkB family protein [Clostridium thermobutyricum]|uniref:YihY family inner membrane protein n=1 Tax=Clostridium thermobutyricum TaxID=29372 RepID=N9WL71_9CLOT|nr:YihY/virulence factor BrkB family protein [Clostridium thermobutyricum]ENZ03615.1 YihY family inner membrane protein [Clostridium thermobutyricum]
MRRKIKRESIIDTLVYLIVKVKNDDIFASGAQLAYYLILSFFPFLIFLMTLIGFSNLSSSEVLMWLQRVLPLNVVDLTKNTIIEVVDFQHTGILGVSIIITLWTASTGFRGVIKGVNRAYDIEENRSFITRCIIAMLGVIALALTVISTLLMSVFGEIIGRYLNEALPFEHIVAFLWNALRHFVIIVILIVVFAIIYKIAPAKKVRFRDVLPGAITSTLGWLIASAGFSYYVNNFSNYSRIYGSLGTVFILMTWLYITSMVFIFGVELNSVLEEEKKWE